MISAPSQAIRHQILEVTEPQGGEAGVVPLHLATADSSNAHFP